MNLDTATLKVLSYFFLHPYKEIHLRELSRRTGLSIFSVKRVVDALVEERILEERRRGNMRYLRANMGSLFFRHLKIAFSIRRIEKSGVVEYLVEKIPAVTSIVLFGSVAKGEDDESSDIDLLVIGQKRKMDLSEFERSLGKEIVVVIMEWSEWREHAKRDRAFYREVITKGIPLYGDIPVIE